ncbi:preprotein translocase subunit SecG [Maritimibacter fusiformis]|uniref:Protein-export membrane protein SecG n=1 Tax=Maritimibacter fusiformis TaxID=2603819 RepID=A0A5D0RH74_9RHOB|nr:preprotein translocase subunit SecG [Maritimibacter fusiformis]TYB80967.1 preprotein translocase subunit SecG [Maritimibacter fusiformis]
MENVILVIHLLLALSLIGVVLLQRSEGGGLGIGGGGGGAMSARGAATALGKVTWLLAIAFLTTSITLTIVSARNAASDSVVDRVIETPAAPDSTTPEAPATPDVGDLMPPVVPGDAPLAPPRAD